MSYQVIARKWRPQSFEEVTGQETVTQTLRNALEYNRLHHAYLFSGARGVGKTTTARLLAKALNCHKTDKPNLTPCRIDDPDACPSCVEISESRSIDVLEFDAASNTQVEKIRDLILQSINVAPARDRFKIFIIDEVHMLSNSSFNALLKTLEEPPPNVVFIMATTELHKIPETILSRCQEFEFRTIALQKIYDRLKLIAGAESIKISDDALREIARSGQGSMRDAQSNFDQVISFSGEQIGVSDVVGALGIAGVEMLTRVLLAISGRKPKDLLTVVSELIARGHDLRNFSRDLLAVFRDILVFKVAGGSEEFVESAALSADDLDKFGKAFSESDLLRFFNSLAETETKLKEATQTRYTLETGLIKLVEMQRVATIESILERLSNLETSSGSKPAAIEEKKTSRSDDLAENKPEPPTFPPIESKPEPVIAKTRSTELAALIDAMPAKLPPISSEDLEHVDDTWLDGAYEMRLQISGDDLSPIQNASSLVEALVGFAASKDPETATILNGQINGSATVPARIIPDVFQTYQEETSTDSLPSLAENATQEELLAYANAHPAVRNVLKIFRGKIVEVNRRGTTDG
ncbi:MAG TPA: DNA polymerase III subunit gamma/tau [Pyrinomonadaceae bacterium]|nr:DNA polymerase III subunit gamma/tau [Pyrinomonadaceae bacterium]